MKQAALFPLLLILAAAACDQNMVDQPRNEVYEASALFPDGKVNQEPVEGTVARGDLEYRRMANTRPPLTRALVERGRERYGIYCAPCHGATGAGDGMIVQRGFPTPPSYHIPRLRQRPARYFVSIIENGGKSDMYPYATRVAPADRWAIAAYIKALQLSQRVPVARLPQDLRTGLPEQPAEETP